MAETQRQPASHKSGSYVIHWAAGYDRLLSVVSLGREGKFRTRIVEAAELRPGQRVLDVGCGTGTLVLAAATAVGAEGSVEGIDPSPEMIARAQSKATSGGYSARFQEASIESLPYPDGCFDAVLSSLMFHHLSESQENAGLAEIHRVLAPGGRLTIVDFVGGGPRLHRLALFASSFSSAHEFERQLRSSVSGCHEDWLLQRRGDSIQAPVHAPPQRTIRRRWLTVSGIRPCGLVPRPKPCCNRTLLRRPQRKHPRTK